MDFELYPTIQRRTGDLRITLFFEKHGSLAVIEGYAKSIVPGIKLVSSEKRVRPDEKLSSSDKKKVIVESSQSQREIQTSVESKSRVN